MSKSDININGGKGTNVPTAEAGKKFREGHACIDFSKDAQGNPRINHANTLAFGDDPEAPLLQPVAPDD